MTTKLKTGYYYCWVHGLTLHDWYGGLTNQEAETWPLNAPIPEDKFLCCKCTEED